MINKPELLAPAGDIHKLKTAFLYGADAVYLGATNFGLRSSAGNFSFDQIVESVKYAHGKGKKMYLVVNTLPHNHEIDETEEFLKTIKDLNLDALIISDPGVLKLAKSYTDYELHLSTQASSVNYESANFWKDFGVTRIILGRETSLKETYEIFDKTGIDLEIFIHGSMCMSYSGKCTISNFLSLRDANRGGCTNSCRWSYTIKDSSNKEIENIYPLNSRDLWAIEEIPQIVKSGKICSLKIEGRMKNHLYLANTISVYRQAIDMSHAIFSGGENTLDDYEKRLDYFKRELMSNMNRTFMTGFLNSRAGSESILYDNKEKTHLYGTMGSIITKVSDEEFVVDIKNPSRKGDEVEFVMPYQGVKVREIKDIKDMSNTSVDIIPNNRLAYITIDQPITEPIEQYTVIRKAEV